MALRILLADDSMTAQNMGKKILTDAGYDVVTVSNGAAAVKKIAEVTPDLAILDVYMPGYNGLEVCERVKLGAATAHTPVLLSVGKMEPFRPEDGMKVKADGVIIKPFEATDLVSVVEKLASRVKTEPPVADAAAASVVAPSASAPAVLESGAAAAATTHFEEPPARPEAAPVLQTFESVDPPLAIPDEPHLEMTSVAPVGAVDVVAPPEFQTTALHDSAADAATRVITDAALLNGYDSDTAVRDQEPNVEDALSDEDREFLSMPVEPHAASTEAPPLAEFPSPQVTQNEHVDAAAGVEQPPPAGASADPMSTWQAEEEELTADDLALDLERAIRAGESHADSVILKDNAPAEAALGDDLIDERTPNVQPVNLESSEGAYESCVPESDLLVDLIPGQNAAPARSAAAPVLAPIGKTSFDELDSIMEQAAAQFETSTASATSTAEPLVELSPEAESAAGAVFDDPLDVELEQATDEPDLLIEEEHANSEPVAPTLPSSDSLSGVFDLDMPDAGETPAHSEPVMGHSEDVLDPSDTAALQPGIVLEQFGSHEYSNPLGDAITDTPAERPADRSAGRFATLVQAELAEAVPLGTVLPSEAKDQLAGGAGVKTDACLAHTEPASQRDEIELHSAPMSHEVAPHCANPSPATSAIENSTIDPVLTPTSESAPFGELTPLMDHATDLAVAAVNAEIQSVPEVSAPTHGPVERVVDRVVDRLRPMLTVMVEEIMKELKK